MLLNAAMSDALDRIADRAADVRRAFTPGAQPRNDDVAGAGDRFDFTLDPLSVAPPEHAYFITLDRFGRTAYTRDGTLAVVGGRVVDSQGMPVLGRRAPGEPLAELRVDDVDAALGRASNVRIEADGTVAYSREAIDPRTGKHVNANVIAGRIGLARFPAATRLDSADGRSFAAPPGVAPHTGFAGDGTFETLVPNRRTHSRVDLDLSLRRLKEAYTAFDALAAAQAAKGRLDKAAMDVVK